MDWQIRQEMILGEKVMEKLKRSTIAIVGIGGVGSSAAEACARAGIGHIILMDHDVVSVSNINRQIVALHSTVGLAKAEVMASRIRDISPEAKLDVIVDFYSDKNREKLFSLNPDYIIDAIDVVTSKIDLILTAHKRNIPIISAMGTGNKLHADMLCVSDLSKTSVCPLCRVMRRELKARGLINHKVVYSKELPIEAMQLEKIDEKRNIPGSVSWVPPVAGYILAGEAICDLISKDDE